MASASSAIGRETIGKWTLAIAAVSNGVCDEVTGTPASDRSSTARVHILPSWRSIEPDVRGATTIREQLEKHRRDASCASCHARFDPLGFALERFDAIGRWREKDGLGHSIDDAGELAGQPIAGKAGLRDYLASHEDELLRNFSRKLLGFALGRAWQPPDELLIDQMRENARTADERFASYITTIVLSPQFRQRREAMSKP